MAARKKALANIPGCELKVVKTSEIYEGKRFRTDYGDLEELTASIRLHGVIQPLAVCMNTPEVGNEYPYMLVAGGRRFRACCMAELEYVPVRVYTDTLDEVELRTLELAENVHRKDMTWQEQNTLQRQIHIAQQKKYGKPDKGGAARDENGEVKGWRVEDTANLLGVSPAIISESLQLAQKMEELPELGWENCKSKADAKKMASVIDETRARIELAKRAAASIKKSGGDLHNTIADAYWIGDAFELLKAQPDESFHFAEIDPPYAIDLPDLKSDNECVGYLEANSATYLIFMKRILEETYRVLRDNSFAVLWFGPDPWFESMHKLAVETGFTCPRIPLIWTKPNGQSLSPNTTLANAYEMAFVLRKGSPVLAKPGRTNVFSYAPTPHKDKWHPTQRPMELISEILNTFSFPNSKVIVPFAGSGVTLLASYLSKRTAIGADMSEEFKPGYISAIPGYFPIA